MNLDSATRTIAGKPIRRCSSCQALIVWFQTAAGNWMPVDATSVGPEDLKLEL